MCMHINNENGAANWIAERRKSIARTNDPGWKRSLITATRNDLTAFQRYDKWLLDYDLNTFLPIEAAAPVPAKRKAPVHREGMKVVRKSLREAEKLPVVKTREKASA